LSLRGLPNNARVESSGAASHLGPILYALALIGDPAAISLPFRHLSAPGLDVVVGEHDVPTIL
jgi:hypothetical protein